MNKYVHCFVSNIYILFVCSCSHVPYEIIPFPPTILVNGYEIICLLLYALFKMTPEHKNYQSLHDSLEWKDLKYH